MYTLQDDGLDQSYRCGSSEGSGILKQVYHRREIELRSQYFWRVAVNHT